MLKAISRLLASEGLASAVFSDPAQFLEHARHHRMRLAVIDLRMPGITGLQVLSELRDVRPETSVIVVTGENEPEHRQEAMEGGAAAFFPKPFDDELFLRAVRAAMAA